MSEEQGKPFEVVGEEAVEARVVSWVLGEASEFEIEELQRLCGERSELELFRRRMASLHGLAGESLEKPQADWRLPPDKRRKVMEAIGVGGSEVRRERSSRFAARRVLFAAAACLVLTVVVAALVFPVFFGGRAWKAGSPAAAARMAERNAAMEADAAAFEAKLDPAAAGSRVNWSMPTRQKDRVTDEAAVKSLSTTTATGDEPRVPAVEPMFRKLREAAQSQAAQSQAAQSRGGGSAPEPEKPAEKTANLRPLAHGLPEVADPGSGPVAGPAPVTQPAAAEPAPSGRPVAPAIAAADESPRDGDVLASTGVSDGKASGDGGGMAGGGGALGGGVATGGLKKDLSDLKAGLSDGTDRSNAAWSARLGETRFGDSYGDDGVISEENGRKPGEKENQKGSGAVATTEKFEADFGAMEGNADVDADGAVSADPFAGAVAGAALKGPDPAATPKPGSPAVAGQVDGGTGLGLEPAEGIEENTARHGKWKREQAGTQSGEPMKGWARGRERYDSGVVEPEELAKAVDEQPPSDAPRGEAKPAAAAAPAEAGNETAARSEARWESESVVDELSVLTGPAQPAGGEDDFRRGMRAPEAPRSAVKELRERISGAEQPDGESRAASESGFKTHNIEVGRDFIGRLSQLEATKESAEGADPFAVEPGADLSLLRRQSAGDALRRYGFALPEGASVDYDAELGTLSVRAPENTVADLEGLVDALPVPPVPPSAADAIDLMAEVSAADEPFSTFSLHVSDASFRVAAAALGRGERPDPQAVRPEEFYNAFDYGDPAPTAGEPVACAVEQCAHPLLPSRNLVRVGVRTAAAGRGAGQALRLTVLLDSSGSMERADRRAAVQAAMTQLASLLGPQDVVTVVGFARQPRLLADRVSGEAIGKELEGLVERTPAEGGTNLEQALALADELAMRQFAQGAQNRIVLLTDGAANLGNADPEELAARVVGLRQRGISFDAAGFGTAGLNDRMLERLTRDGDGRYYVVDGPEDADEQFARKLAGAFRPAAENVKVQVRFNPARVGGYRLIGFEEHRLNKEDFRDDTVDAAEMAAEEAGVAVYQVELLPEGEGEIGEVSVRFRDASKGRMIERSWTMPHDESAPAFDQAPASMQVAGLAVLAADTLRDGPLAPLTDWGGLAPVTSQVRAGFGGSEQVGQLLRMVERLRE